MRPSLPDANRTGIPNNPVSIGNISVPSPNIPVQGIGNSLTAMPNIPDNVNAASPWTMALLEPHPRMMMDDATNATVQASLSIRPPMDVDIKHCKGTANSTAQHAPTRLPDAAAFTASIPLPSSSNLCPGRTETASSESGDPMNTDGTKSTNEWTTDADMTQQHTATIDPAGSTMPDSIPWIAGYDASISEDNVFT
jgi:hypothetical protein